MSSTIQVCVSKQQDVGDFRFIGDCILFLYPVFLFLGVNGADVKDRWDVWTDTIDLERFIVDNNMKDPRGHDCHLVGPFMGYELE